MRAEIVKLIEKIQPGDALEELQRQEVLEWIDSGVEIFRIAKPATPPRHLVAYFVVYDEAARKVLLVDHKKALLWLPSGGHVEVGEHPMVTVRRECREELGIEADFWRDEPLLVTITETVGLTAGHEDVSLWYVLREDCQKKLVWDAEEFNGIKWFGLDEVLLAKSDPHMARFLTKLCFQAGEKHAA